VNRPPVWAVPQWTRAVEAAGGQCQCDTWTKGHAHHTHDRRCPRRRDSGTRLYLAADGRVRCESCHDHAEKTAKAKAAAEKAARDADQGPTMDALF